MIKDAFPDVDELARGNKIDSEQAEMIMETKTEALKENMELLSGDNIGSDHAGPHNDLLHLWLLSLLIVFEYQKNNFEKHGTDIIYGGAGFDTCTSTNTLNNLDEGSHISNKGNRRCN